MTDAKTCFTSLSVVIVVASEGNTVKLSVKEVEVISVAPEYVGDRLGLEATVGLIVGFRVGL